MGSRAVGAPLRRRPRDAACSRRSSWASAASACCARWGCHPPVYHLNEGHAAFVVLQRIREFLDGGHDFDSALAEVRRTTVFTTHTPVPAGHDAFAFHMVERHLAGCWGPLGEHRARFLALGEYDNGERSAVQHDRAGPAVGRRRQRRQPAARRGDALDVGADVARECARRGAVDVGDQRRPCADLDLDGPGRAVRPLPGTRLDRPSRRAGALGSRAGDPRRGALGRALGAAPPSVCVHPRARPCALDRGSRQRQPRAGGRPDARRQHAHAGIRPPVHRLQTSLADLSAIPIGWLAS